MQKVIMLLSEQHKEILSLVQHITDTIEQHTINDVADGLFDSLKLLSIKLGIHLSLEDESFYPFIFRFHKGTELCTLAHKYVVEMGDIVEMYNIYNKHWNSAESIRAHSASFVEETKRLFTSLQNRITRENTELFALLEKGV